jgi:hypothetical protein
MKTFFHDLFKDKNENFSLRELAIAVFVLVLVVSWIARQFFKLEVPEFMFYSFSSLIAAGLFGYSLEKKTNADAS